jgi:hypothetical protein
MNELPKEVLQNVTDFLLPSEAVKLSSTSKQLHAQLLLRTTSVIRFLKKYARADRTDAIQYATEIPILPDMPIHTLFISMIWRDQGWGNKKGQVLVISKSKEGIIRVVYTSKVAPHSRQKLRIGIHPKDDETYHLCYKVGDSGGHEMNLCGIRLIALVYDDNLGFATNAWKFLSRALLPWDEILFHNDDSFYTLLASAQYLLQNNESMPPPLVEYFDGFGITAGGVSLKFLDMVAKAMAAWKLQCTVYIGVPIVQNWEEEPFSDDIEPDETDPDLFHRNLGEVVANKKEGERALIFVNDPETSILASRRVLRFFGFFDTGDIELTF